MKVNDPTPSMVASMTSPLTTALTPGRVSGHDDIAGGQLEIVRQTRDHLGDLPDHLVQVALLAKFTVQVQRYAPVIVLQYLEQHIANPTDASR
ncbi:hypothetical protein [Yoonia sediminilitoris]|uniref:hypothetical protein n=1 Tax=Yoonia sediminilitoris TaxID=1286148 RepID=UPI000DF1A370|nr:hypothetical protein [Yoonia sediminilitoris]